MFIEASFTVVKTWKQRVHQRRCGMCVYTHNGIYTYIHTVDYHSAKKKKKRHSAICSNLDGSRENYGLLLWLSW